MTSKHKKNDCYFICRELSDELAVGLDDGEAVPLVCPHVHTAAAQLPHRPARSLPVPRRWIAGAALRVVGGQLQLDMVFNSTLMFSVTFSGRAVADGLLHHVAVTRCSHLVELRLDDGEGVNYRT